MGAEAAAIGTTILLRESAPAIDLVRHEVVHALQSSGFALQASNPQLLDERAAAEQEAAALPQVPQHRLTPGTVALRRTQPGVSSTEKQQQQEDFQEANRRATQAKEAEQEAERQKAKAGETETEPKEEPGLELNDPGKALEEKPSPTFTPPEMPDTSLSPEQQAERQAAMDKAQAQMDAATSAEGVIGAYAGAPPSLMASAQSTLGKRVKDVVQQDSEKFAADLPDMHAQMGGSPQTDTAPAAVTAPSMDQVLAPAEDLQPATIPDIPKLPSPGPYEKNNEVVQQLFKSLGFGKSEKALGESLADVATTDPDIQTSPGDVPPFPMDGENDPKQLDDQSAEAMKASLAKQKEAAQAVIDGRGPEAVQPREMNEVHQVPDPESVTVPGIAASPEAEKFAARGLPEEVLFQFDKDAGPEMQEHLAKAHKTAADAERKRDEDRSNAVQTAKTQEDGLTRKAAEQQGTAVNQSRQEIQNERQQALDDQSAALKDLDSQTKTARNDQKKEIDDRVSEDRRQIETKYEEGEKAAQAEVEKGEKKAEEEKIKAEREAADKRWWEQAWDFVKSAFNALVDAIKWVFNKVRDAVKFVLDKVRDFAKGLIDLFAGFLKKLIGAFGALLKGLIDNTIGLVFPEVAQKLNDKIDSAVETAQKGIDAAADALKAGIDAVIDVLNKAINIALDVFEAALIIGVSLVEGVVTGDWSAAGKRILESVLKVLGIEPADFYAFVGRAMEVIGKIVDDPGAFLSNLVDAIRQGFNLFGENFLTHLKRGVIAWLTGALGDITMPSEFSLIGVLDIARQVMGLTWDWVKKKAGQLIGEKNVERLEFVYGYVDTLVNEGFTGLFERISGELEGLVDSVLSSIKEYLVTSIITAGIKWIISLFNPVGALIKLVMTIWNLITFVREQLDRIKAIAVAIVDSIVSISEGVVGPAAAKIEEVLGNMVPVAIDLVAKLLGLNGVGDKVREVIGGIRKRVELAIDKLLRKFADTFSGKKKGKEAKKEGDAKDTGPGVPDDHVGDVLPVTLGGAHSLSIDVVGQSEVPTIHSNGRAVSAWLSDIETKFKQNPGMFSHPNTQTAVKSALKTAKRLDKRTADLADEVRHAAEGSTERTKAEKKLSAAELELKDAIVHLFSFFADILQAPDASESTPATGEKAAISSLFAQQLEHCDPAAIGTVKTALAAGFPKYQTMQWDQVRAHLVKNRDELKKPMLKGWQFGEIAQEKAKDHIPSDVTALVKDEPEEEQRVLSSWIVRLINDGHTDKAAAARSELRKVAFGEIPGGIKSAPIKSLKDAVHESARAFQEQGAGADPELKAKVAEKKGVIPFLKYVATENDPQIDKKWREVWWKDGSANQKWIAERFRGSGGKHEWIPTNYIGEVMNYARAQQNNPNAPINAASWIDFQDTLRTDTKNIMFSRAYWLKAPVSPASEEATQLLIQGHAGALYAPIHEGKWRADNEIVQQTHGQKEWHDKLRAIFKNAAKGTSKAGRDQIVENLATFADSDLWHGQTHSPAFDKYYDSGKAPLSMKEIQSRASKAQSELETAIDKAKEVTKDFVA
ncbi:hypothetical protein F183_A33500 [Bryobacterales bacterium F-183]|nr:hypothetical protein F183_A33500 [Bryobacterales bacterium F-183]